MKRGALERYEAALTPSQRFLVEFSPLDALIAPRLASLWPEAKLIHVLRDGRDVAAIARTAWRKWPEEWRAAFGGPLRPTARAWATGYERAEEARRAAPERFLEVRFEDLKGDRWTWHRKMLDFCGIPYTAEHLEAVHDATGRRPQQSEIWRERLSVVHSLLFDRWAGRELRASGYENDRRWWWRLKPP